ncbi:MAG: hypothetical protein HYS32_02550 [Candidatus Woesearchaeota archaeon]|nr:MAG: hypothetical protein HYS32_02550 [Candidatus Woesearchaeota archaeon]
MKKLVKKITALGVGAAMLGATLTSAVALDLADYPAPFLVNGKFAGGVIVAGDDAQVADTFSAVGLATHWQQNSYTSSEGKSVSVTGGKTEKVPLDDGGGNTEVGDANYLDNELDDEDLEFLADSTLNFQSKEYDYREALYLWNAGTAVTETIALKTSLTSSDDDYESDVVLELVKKAIGYYVVFDESINISKATTNDALKVDFLGKRIKITGASATQFTAQVGEEHFMNVGDSVVVNGKTVTLNNVGSGGAINVDVDGVIETISASGTETINGLEINNDETFYDSNDVSQRSATLIIGEDAVETYKDGDAYVGEDENNPDWVWDVVGLTNDSATSVIATVATGGLSVQTGPGIGILNDFSVNSDDDDQVVGTREGMNSCYSLPNNFIEVCLDSLTLDDEDYMRVKIETVDDLDLDGTGLGRSGDDKAVLIESDEAEGLRINNAEFTGSHVKSAALTADEKTNQIWLRWNGTKNFTDVFFWHRTNANVTWAGTMDVLGITSTDAEFGYVNWGDTKDTSATAQSVLFNIRQPNLLSSDGNSQLVIDVGTDDTRSPSNGADDIIVHIKGGNSTDYNAIGNTSNSEEAGELVWGTTTTLGNVTNIGTKDEDHRGIYGIVIRDPKNHGASDEVVIDIPNDQLYANIVVKGQATQTAAGSGKVLVPLDVDAITKKSSEITGQESKFNLLLVGGPCVNPTIAAVSGLSAYAACDAWSLKVGEGVAKVVDNGGKVALLVAGTTGDDTAAVAKDLRTGKLSSDEAIVRSV